MRSYLGEREASGQPIVWVIDEHPTPEVSEINQLLADLPPPRDAARSEPDWPQRRDAWLARKEDLIARIEASERPDRRPLRHIEVHSPGGFEWGYRGSGPADLAHAVLSDHLGVEPTEAVRLQFRDEVIAGLPEERFRVPESLVRVWVAANRELIDRELFLTPPDASLDQAWSIIDREAPSVSDERTLVSDPATASTLVAACESAWRDIRAHHPDLPDAVIVLGTGVERGRLVKLGHWWGGQWVADGQPRGEVLLAGEALHLEPARVFEVLLHEAAHGINAARGIKDTSRGGRYHNKHFATAARQVLLRVRAVPPYGLAATDLTPEARDRYGATIERLGDAMRIARQLRAGVSVGAGGGEIEGTLAGGKGDGKDADDGQTKTGATATACGCGRKMRMAPTTLAAGPVVCGLCGTEFASVAERKGGAAQPDPSEVPGADMAADAVIERSFLTRRRAAIAAEPDQGSALPDPVVRILDRQRTRLEAVLSTAHNPEDPLYRPLSQRRDRLESILTDSLAFRGGASAETSHASGAITGGPDVAEPQSSDRNADHAIADAADADYEVLSNWYERYGTHDEAPMPAATAADAARRERLARTLLKADGTLHGPAVTTIAGTELQAGDHVQATADHGDLPAGTPGTVELVEPGTGRVEIDFATWGRLRTTLTDSLARDLRHDYAEVRTTGLEPGGIEL